MRFQMLLTAHVKVGNSLILQNMETGRLSAIELISLIGFHCLNLIH